MPYGPHAEADRARMRSALGIDSVDALFADIPQSVRAQGLELPDPVPEAELSARLRRLAARNVVDAASFLGAGAYRHYVPAAVDQLISRGEFYTAYTPYQPEVSQGTLQTIYEYQSMMAELTGMDVVSASHYDGATAAAEAALMAIRATRRDRLLLSAALHPHHAATVRTYVDEEHFAVETIPTAPDGTTDLAVLERMLGEGKPVAGVLVGQPNAFGILESMAEVGRLAHAAGALFVADIEPVSLAVLASPGEYGADIAAGEGQPLGMPLAFGGPYLGILGTREQHIRQIPGRLIGRTKDLDGRTAYVMTLRAREQDIRRERAASNICSNQALCALVATIYLSLIGPRGLHDVAAVGAARAKELEDALGAAGAPRLHAGPYLNEFAVRVPNAPAVHAALLDREIVAGLPLASWFPDDPVLRDGLLVCATEVTTSDEIARFASTLREVTAAGSVPGHGEVAR